MAEIIHQREIKRLRTELEKNPESPELHFEPGKALLRVFSHDAEKEGIRHLEMAIKIKPDFAEAVELLSNEIMEENPVRDQNSHKRLPLFINL